MKTTAHRLITPMMVLNMLVICLLLLVDISLARHQSSWLPITSSSQHHVRNRNHAALTSSRILQNNVIQKHLNDGDDSLHLSERSGLESINRQRHAILAAACNAAIGCRGGGDCSSTDVIVEDTISVSVPLQNSNVDRINTPRNLSTEAILLSIRGGGAAVSDHDNNVIQSIIKSILDFPSLPTPMKNIIELICQFLESISGFKIMPNKEVMTKKKKKQSSKAKKKKSTGAKQQQSRKKVLVEEVSVGVASTTKKKKKRRAKQEEVKMTSVAQKIKVDEEESESSDDEEEEEQSTVKEKASATLPTTTTTTSKPKPNKSKPDAASQKFLSNNLKSSNPNYRIQRELKEFIKSPPPGLSVKISGKNVRLWIVTLTMPENTSIYAGEKYKLRIQFPNDYPTSPPSVYFLPPTPRHEHVYTNGDICLSLLGKDWRPIMTASSIAGSIMSILCGAQRKSLPMDNARHASNKPGKKQDDWVYHDDNC